MRFSTSAVLAFACAAASVAAQDVPKFQYGTPNPNMAGVKGSNSNGPTNPDMPSLNTPINQTSVSRLASVNSVDDWCTFASPDGEAIADVEDRTVAYCTKARNNARVIPDGTLTAVHFVKTPLYVQVMALGDFTKIGMQAGDQGGELDPHGATNLGNPIGGNVTSNVSGSDVFYEEWMNFVSYEQVCIRVCIAGTDVAPTPLECQHTLDEMGCNFVMPGSYAPGVFDTCDGDSAYPPGLYPQGNGQTSTFQQYFSSGPYVNGSPDQQTPSAAYSVPATSNCVTKSTISNGISSIIPTSSAAPSSSMSVSRSGGSSAAAESTPASGSGSGGSGSSSSSSSSSGGSSGAASIALPVMALVSVSSIALAAMLL